MAYEKTLLEELMEKYGFTVKPASKCTKEELKNKSITMVFKPENEILKIRTKKI